MATLTFNGNSFTVDHAIKGADYVHGYSATGECLVSIEGIKDFSVIAYDGTYLAPTACTKVKNIYAGTSDLTAGTSFLTAGTLYVVYE